MTTINTVNEPTYAEMMAAKQAKKEAREWKRIQANAKVYDATRLPRQTVSVAGDEVLLRLQRKAKEMVDSGKERIAQMAAWLTTETDLTRVMEWSGRDFDAAGEVKVGRDIMAIIEQLQQRKDEYSAPGSVQIIRCVREGLTHEVLRAARYPERSSSMQSNLIAQSIAAARAKLLENITDYCHFYGIN